MNASVGGAGSVVNVTTNQSAYGLSVQSSGRVAVGAGAVLSISTDTSVTGGATLSIDPVGFFSTGGTFTLDGGSSVTGGPVTAAAYQLNDGTISANLGGTGGVDKDSGGTVALSGTNTFAGGVVVKAGTLIVTNSNALPDGTSLTVGAGGTLVFDSSLSAGPFTTARAPALVAAAPNVAARSEPETMDTTSAALSALVATAEHSDTKHKRRISGSDVVDLI